MANILKGNPLKGALKNPLLLIGGAALGLIGLLLFMKPIHTNPTLGLVGTQSIVAVTSGGQQWYQTIMDLNFIFHSPLPSTTNVGMKLVGADGTTIPGGGFTLQAGATEFTHKVGQPGTATYPYWWGPAGVFPPGTSVSLVYTLTGGLEATKSVTAITNAASGASFLFLG